MLHAAERSVDRLERAGDDPFDIEVGMVSHPLRIYRHAVETEIVRLADFLRALSESGTLKDYVARRRAEVMSESRTLYVSEVNS